MGSAGHWPGESWTVDMLRHATVGGGGVVVMVTVMLMTHQYLCLCIQIYVFIYQSTRMNERFVAVARKRRTKRSGNSIFLSHQKKLLMNLYTVCAIFSFPPAFDYL